MNLIENVTSNFFLHSIDLKEMFYDTIDRIEIRRKNAYGRFWKLEICYNVKKVGKFGVCQTKNAGNWGFCSRSCIVGPVLGINDPYEEAEFKYFDEAPEGSLFSR